MKYTRFIIYRTKTQFLWLFLNTTTGEFKSNDHGVIKVQSLSLHNKKKKNDVFQSALFDLKSNCVFVLQIMDLTA